MNEWYWAKHRKEQVLMVNDLLGHYDRAVYVGAQFQRNGPRHLRIVRNHAPAVDCWEIYRPNVDAITPLGWFDDIACIDVVDAVHNGWLDRYGLLFWYHGPEHLEYTRAIAVLGDMIACKSVALVVGCPWGIFVQPDELIAWNPFNDHKSQLYPEDFERLGFNVSVCGNPHGRMAGILAWRIP